MNVCVVEGLLGKLGRIPLTDTLTEASGDDISVSFSDTCSETVEIVCDVFLVFVGIVFVVDISVIVFSVELLTFFSVVSV